MLAYPSTLPCVSRIEGLSSAADPALVRSPVQAAAARQRRANVALAHRFSLVFVMPQTVHAVWLDWMNANAFDGWVLLVLPGVLASRAGTPTAPTPVRFISDIAAELLPVHRRWYWRCRVDAEWLPTADDLAPVALGNWVVAGTPAAASAPDWVIGGTPAAPSMPEWIVGGVPDNPSAWI